MQIQAPNTKSVKLEVESLEVLAAEVHPWCGCRVFIEKEFESQNCLAIKFDTQHQLY